jgi:predicted acetyltransferase
VDRRPAGPAGLFDYPRLSRFFTDADHDAYLISSDSRLAGFCLIRPFDGEATIIHTFFILRALRRQGVGLAAATDLLRSRPGRWAIAFLEQNAPAARFWRQVATEVVGKNRTEELRRRPDGVTFTFIHIDVDQDRRIPH